MTKWTGLSILLGTTLLVTFPGPAAAQQAAVDDGPRDTFERGLDFTRVAFRNQDHAIVAVMNFSQDRRGDAIFLVRVRDRGEVALVVSEHPRSGPDSLTLQTRTSDDAACAGLRSTWDRTNAHLQIRLPSRCVLRGNYGAIKMWALTEVFHGGADVDYAPEEPNGDLRFTDWIPRG